MYVVRHSVHYIFIKKFFLFPGPARIACGSDLNKSIAKTGQFFLYRVINQKTYIDNKNCTSL